MLRQQFTDDLIELLRAQFPGEQGSAGLSFDDVVDVRAAILDAIDGVGERVERDERDNPRRRDPRRI
jgi:hypothetical protein